MQKSTPWIQMAVLSLALALHAQDVVRPMPANANPAFEAVTIKPSDPESQGKDFSFQGHRVWARNYNVDDIIAIAYGLHARQIVGAPAWLSATLYDINGVPDVEGVPNQRQKKLMMQKLLADRFQLTFHREKRTLAVYAITLAPGGPKLTQSAAGPDDPDLFRLHWPNGVAATNMTLAEFAIWFQKVVMDKPVVDHTGLTGRYTFELNWTPNESQFTQLRGTGLAPPPPTNDPNAPPGLFTAIREQLGLKLEAIKAPVDVIVIDHINRPSPN
jgi:uncharacterized protein (TIGR03435 family)